MLVPYLDNLTSSWEDDITDIEREKIKEYDCVRGSCFDRYDEFTERNVPSIVLDDFLFLGNLDHAKNRELLERFQIKHILNVCDYSTNKDIHENFNVTEIQMPDYPDTNIRQHFERTNELLRGCYEKNERCLVHCAAGISRSATIVLAYLMKYHHNTLKEAYFYLIEKRPQICPNDGFLIQLIRYENELIQSREIKIENENKPIIKEENPIETINEFENKHKQD